MPVFGAMEDIRNDEYLATSFFFPHVRAMTAQTVVQTRRLLERSRHRGKQKTTPTTKQATKPTQNKNTQNPKKKSRSTAVKRSHCLSHKFSSVNQSIQRRIVLSTLTHPEALLHKWPLQYLAKPGPFSQGL